MKKLLCVVPALVLFAMIGAPNASADSYTATFACGNITACTLGVPATQTVSFPSPTIVMSFLVSGLEDTFNVTLPATDTPADTYQWFFEAIRVGIPSDPGSYTYDDYIGVIDQTSGLTTQDYRPGAGIPADQGGPLTFSPVTAATLEPAPIILMLLGVGLIFVMRKRFIMHVAGTA